MNQRSWNLETNLVSW